MTMNEAKKIQSERFNSLASDWSNSDEAIRQAEKAVNVLGIQSGQSLLDVASGTGVILHALKQLQISPGHYLAMDISSAMLEKLHSAFPEAETACADFEQPFTCQRGFDYVLIYNSIPHFSDLDMLFTNAKRSLLPGGTFMIAHSRTRQGLKEHHQRIGYKSERAPIPADEELALLAENYDFDQISFADEEFFCFTCHRKG
ncbi:class I SAM-dependent methyltransferase [Paenibacillus riograndensis]|uniref:Type 11 methyltransferase n=2 Tax=Paenibacillus riograndensis TaxID=483937 RepID=A0A0E3WJI5_9BACL|nr:class I SAM-dependent methyltransferase [Paenibacillus riograndensis]CQR58848.1 type 11 methyltransferase [Paenibacillus riograndensis SBR5]